MLGRTSSYSVISWFNRSDQMPSDAVVDPCCTPPSCRSAPSLTIPLPPRPPSKHTDADGRACLTEAGQAGQCIAVQGVTHCLEGLVSGPLNLDLKGVKGMNEIINGKYVAEPYSCGGALVYRSASGYLLPSMITPLGSYIPASSHSQVPTLSLLAPLKVLRDFISHYPIAPPKVLPLPQIRCLDCVQAIWRALQIKRSVFGPFRPVLEGCKIAGRGQTASYTGHVGDAHQQHHFGYSAQ